MIEYKIDNLRDKLNLMILKNEEYSKILEISQELDELIVQYYIKIVSQNLIGISDLPLIINTSVVV